MTLVSLDHPSLRKEAKEVDPTTTDFTNLIEELSRIRQEKNGLGIAAPQVGASVRIINFLYRGREYVVFNPYITNSKGSTRLVEGCLSLPGNLYKVRRSTSLTLHGLDKDGKSIKFKADITEAHLLEHEVDHLDGILIDTKGKFFGTYTSKEGLKLAFGEQERLQPMGTLL